MELRNFSMHLWNEKSFKAVGYMFGGFIDFTDENSSLIECLEVTIKVKGNYWGFVLVEFELIDDLENFLLQVVTF